MSPEQITKGEPLHEDHEGINLHRLFHVVREYRLVIQLSMVLLAVGYGVAAIAYYLLSPAERLTYQRFRLDFNGAERGVYPNGSKFSANEIISPQVLQKTYENNNLSKYLAFGDFSRSIFVLVSNMEYERLAADYQSRLSDPKLSPVDRERLEKDFDLKLESVSKNEFSINFARSLTSGSVPEALARKVLSDMLVNWADIAVNEQHVFVYDLSVLSPEVLRPTAAEDDDAVASIEILRSKALHIWDNVWEIRQLPSANLARTPDDHVSLEELQLRIEEIIRFQLDPLMAAAVAGGLANPRKTVVFLENQLAYDQRLLEAQQRRADATRTALMMYSEPRSQENVGTVPERRNTPGSEPVMAQLSDNFLDRIFTLAGRSADIQYRQKLVDDYTAAVKNSVPQQQNVAYDERVLDQVRKAPLNQKPGGDPTLRAQVADVRKQLLTVVIKANSLFQIVSHNMSPPTQLFTLIGPSTSRVQHNVSLTNLALLGVLVLLVAFPVIVVLCMVHHIIREDERLELKEETAQTA